MVEGCGLGLLFPTRHGSMGRLPQKHSPWNQNLQKPTIKSSKPGIAANAWNFTWDFQVSLPLLWPLGLHPRDEVGGRFRADKASEMGSPLKAEQCFQWPPYRKCWSNFFNLGDLPSVLGLDGHAEPILALWRSLSQICGLACLPGRAEYHPSCGWAFRRSGRFFVQTVGS